MDIGSDESAAAMGNKCGQVLVNVAKLGVNRLLSLNVLPVQPGNKFGIRFLPL